ncbi:hypothetical protein AB0G74_15425 [Streptomyces sp. NPDC020875]|uniref:hypothetical protein n=1 Tax=Streptomyces sp. NPDC020875 TaxID=3154898 RepID=UPI0033F47D42
MTAHSPRRALRAVAVTAAALGALLAGGTAAVADAKPSPTTPVKVELSKEAAAKAAAEKDCTPQPAKAGEVKRICLTPTDVERKRAAGVLREGTAVVPRGGVAAGERPAGQGGSDSTMLIAGSAIGALGLAVAGTVVLRRRAAHGDAR